MKRSLNFKINILVMTVVTMFFSVFIIVDYVQKSKTLSSKLNSQLSITANRLNQTLKIPIWNLDYDAITNIIVYEMQNRNIRTICVYDSLTERLLTGKTRDQNWNITGTTEPCKFTQFNTKKEVIHNNRAIANIDVQATDRFIKKEVQREMITEIIRMILLVLIFIVILTKAIHIVFLKPIKKLNETVQKISRGNISVPLDLKRNDELGDLARNFINMRETIRQKIDIMNNEISERTKIENELRESEQNLSTTLNSIGDAVITTDNQGNITRMNPIAEKLTKCKFSNSRGKKLGEVINIIDIRTNETKIDAFARVMKREKITGLAEHNILITRDGAKIPDFILRSSNHGFKQYCYRSCNGFQGCIKRIYNA